MSLFNTKTFWSNRSITDEEFDHNCLKVSKLNDDYDSVLVGSHSGILRIYKPSEGFTNDSVEFRPNDLLLEKCLPNPILQVDVGRLVSGSTQKQIAVLHPRSVVVHSLIAKEGIAEHGTEYILNGIYEHKLQASAANFLLGGFGGVQNRDFICVQSLDGRLFFFEQENFNFRCSLADFLLPNPMVYVKSSDSFVTAGANWYLQSYRYKSLSEVNNQNGSATTNKVAACEWSFNLGETVLDIRSLYDSNTRQSFITVLGERNLYCFSDSGKMKFMKRFEFSTSCFFTYYSDEGKHTALVISETGTLLIYQDVTLTWSAKLHFLPVCVQRAFFKEVPGALVLLSEDGILEFCYLGTQPIIFSAPPLRNQDLNFETAEAELSTLNKMIKSTLHNEMNLAHADVEKEISLTLSVNPHLEDYIDENVAAINGKCCNVTVEIVPRAIFEEVHVMLSVQKPFVVTPQTALYNNLSDSTRFNCQIFLEEDVDVPSLDLEVALSMLTNIGIPKVSYKKTTLPLKLIHQTCKPIKDGNHKITVNTNQNPVPLSTLFSEYVGENSLSVNSNAIGFQNHGSNGPVVTVLVAKSSQRYRLQSDSLSSLNIIAQETIRRLKLYFSGTENFIIYVNSGLPSMEVIEYIRNHFECVRSVNDLQNDLDQLSAQLRLIQKHLISKFKQKNPASMSNLHVVLQDTNKEILEVITKLDDEQEKLTKSQIKLSCVLSLLVSLVGLSENGKDLSSVHETLSPYVYDIKGQNWEDVTDASLCYLLRTHFSKSDRDKMRAPHACFDEVKDLSKVEKHLTQLLERIPKKRSIDKESNDEVLEEETRQSEEKEQVEEISYIGSEIGSSSSRALSARKSLLRRRHKLEE